MTTFSLTNLNAELLARNATVPQRETRDGLPGKLWADRAGVLVTLPKYQAWVREGSVWCFNAGLAATAVQAAGTYDADAPDMSLDIPAGITIHPLSIELTVAALKDDEDVGIHILASRTLTAVTGGTAVTPINMRLDLDGKSQCTAYNSIDAAGCTDPNTSGAAYEFGRKRLEIGEVPTAGDSVEGQLTTHTWTAVGQGYSPPLVGAASLCLYFATPSMATFYCTIIYHEQDSRGIV